MILYELRTRTLGSYHESFFYFDDIRKARDILDELDNGDITKWNVVGKWGGAPWYMYDGCTWNELTHGGDINLVAHPRKMTKDEEYILSNDYYREVKSKEKELEI